MGYFGDLSEKWQQQQSLNLILFLPQRRIMPCKIRIVSKNDYNLYKISCQKGKKIRNNSLRIWHIEN